MSSPASCTSPVAGPMTASTSPANAWLSSARVRLASSRFRSSPSRPRTGGLPAHAELLDAGAQRADAGGAYCPAGRGPRRPIARPREWSRGGVPMTAASPTYLALPTAERRAAVREAWADRRSRLTSYAALRPTRPPTRRQRAVADFFREKIRVHRGRSARPRPCSARTTTRSAPSDRASTPTTSPPTTAPRHLVDLRAAPATPITATGIDRTDIGRVLRVRRDRARHRLRRDHRRARGDRHHRPRRRIAEGTSGPTARQPISG